MKKYLLFFLLFILPLQYSWSAAAVYCNHENETSPHFGHHDHQHKVEKKDEGNGGKAGKVHIDCSVCQFSAHASLPSALINAIGRTPVRHHASPVSHFTSHIPDTPAVPDWLLVA